MWTSGDPNGWMHVMERIAGLVDVIEATFGPWNDLKNGYGKLPLSAQARVWPTGSRSHPPEKPPRHRFAGREAQMHSFGFLTALNMPMEASFVPGNNPRITFTQSFSHLHGRKSCRIGAAPKRSYGFRCRRLVIRVDGCMVWNGLLA